MQSLWPWLSFIPRRRPPSLPAFYFVVPACPCFSEWTICTDLFSISSHDPGSVLFHGRIYGLVLSLYLWQFSSFHTVSSRNAFNFLKSSRKCFRVSLYKISGQQCFLLLILWTMHVLYFFLIFLLLDIISPNLSFLLSSFSSLSFPHLFPL